MPKRFPYYARLSDAEKRIYRRSDAIGAVELPNVMALLPLVASLEIALEGGKRIRVARAVEALSAAVFEQLAVSVVRIRVREVRPDIGGAELYGQYTFATDEAIPIIEVWMRTLAHERVVKFKTFLRTLLHEMVHHLDVTLFGLKESFHTEGFFRRESSLVKQLLRNAEPRNRSEPQEAAAKQKASLKKPQSPQLGLFDAVAMEPVRRRRSPKKAGS